ncbi:MAG: adenosylcobinamide-phosphate synthase CbiB [Campylobacterota bacterium]|nr:adenosylcobinamide-phosphate synthase CbiB [Campylobacterota bacterium]
MYLEIVLIAYIVDRLFGEFKYIKHPVVLMGDYIKWFENKFYKDCFLNGILLTISLILIVFCISFTLSFLPMFIVAIISSMGIASKMLYDSVEDIISNKENIKYLVSRDTKDLSNSDINKAAIETYAENLNDGVVAPIFYLIFFGIVGLFIYKAVNTLDSMVGYKNKKYEKFGKFSARLDDVLNYIPSRVTALLIALLFFSYNSIKTIIKDGYKHESPNAGYPISAMAGAIGITLGGDTSYFGKIKKKAYFGDGKIEIENNDIKNGLNFQKRFDIFIIFLLISILFNIKLW